MLEFAFSPCTLNFIIKKERSGRRTDFSFIYIQENTYIQYIQHKVKNNFNFNQKSKCRSQDINKDENLKLVVEIGLNTKI